MRSLAILLATLVVSLVPASGSSAMTMEACGAKYRLDKAGGSDAAAMGWNAYRLSKCVGNAQATAEHVQSEPIIVAAAASTGDAGSAVFPSAVDPQCAKETPTKARFKTCVAQYRVNKASHGNGGLKWVQKGGGYYSACNKRLKAAKEA